jgi:hypothetical protein
LRLWRADNGGHPVWRLSLEEVGAEQRYLFHSVNDVQSFLNDLMIGHEDDGGAVPGADRAT